MMKRLLLLVLMVAILSHTVAALSVTPTVTFDNSGKPLTRSNPASDDDNRRNDVTASSSFTVAAGSNETITVTNIQFIPVQKYNDANFNVSFENTSFVVDASQSKPITVTTRVPEQIDSVVGFDKKGSLDDESPEQIGRFVVTYDSGSQTGLTQEITARMTVKLMIDVSFNVYVNGDRFRLDSDRLNELRTDDDVKLCIEVKNRFDDKDDIDMDVEINVDGESDFDADDDSDDFSLDAEEKYESCFTFDIDERADDERFDVDVQITATDAYGTDHVVDDSFRVRFNRPDYDVKLDKFTVRPTSVCPGDSFTVYFTIKNQGKRENQVSLIVSKEDIGLSKTYDRVRLDASGGRDDSYSDSTSFIIPDSAHVGNYDVKLEYFYERSRNDQTSSFETQPLTVRDCTPPPSNNNNDNDDNGDDNGGIIVQPPTTQQPTIPQPTTPIVVAKPAQSSSDNVWYIAGLAIVVIILIVVIGWLIVVLTRRR